MGGSSVFGWGLGIVFAASGWPGMALCVVGMCALAALIAVAALRRPRAH
ncbi:hypothetical protein [Microbacterium sp. 18062]|nr:hypothetical protein [Microbacterium sp. 18062]